MKHIFKHILVVYLAFFMLLASMAIPYQAMTCEVSNVKSYAFMNSDFDCEDLGETVSCKETAIEKSNCCLFDDGLIETNAELVHSSINDFQALVAYIEIPVPSIRILAAKATSSFKLFDVDIPEQDIRILQQSFLC